MTGSLSNLPGVDLADPGGVRIIPDLGLTTLPGTSFPFKIAAIPATVLKSVFEDVSLSVLSRDFLSGVLNWGKDSALQFSRKFGVLRSPLILEFGSSTPVLVAVFFSERR